MNESRKKSLIGILILPLSVFIFLICTYDNLGADVGSTYKCKMVENLGITDGNLSRLEKYELQEFSFTREKTKLKFGKSDNYFQGAEYEVTKSFEKMFLALVKFFGVFIEFLDQFLLKFNSNNKIS